MKFTTVKQVQVAIRRRCDRIGIRPFLEAKAADGNHGRLYYLWVAVAGPITAYRAELAGHTGLGLTLHNVFAAHPKSWVQGGIDRQTLLSWANEAFPEGPCF